MTDEWFYKRGEAAFGPVEGSILHDLIRRKRLSDQTLVRQNGTDEWITVSEARPSLPPLPEVVEPVVEMAETLPFDSSLPGASVIYAPPQATITVPRKEFQVPIYLTAGVVMAFLLLTCSTLSWLAVGVLYASNLLGVEPLPMWLQKVSEMLSTDLPINFLRLAILGQLIAVVVWQGCAFASLRRLYGESMVHRSIASGLWWMVPIASLFMPLFCLREMRYLSRKRRDFPNQKASFGPLLIVFETLVLIDVPLNVVSAIVRMKTHKDMEIGPVLSFLDLLSDFQGAVLGAVVLAIVIGNFRQQRELYAHWRDDNHWKGR